MKRERIGKWIVVMLMLLLFYCIGNLQYKVSYAGSKLMMEEYNRYRMMAGIALTLLGVLLESKSLVKVIREGVKINYFYLVTAVILISYPLIRYETALNTFGLAYKIVTLKSFVALMYQSAYSRSAMSIVGGVLLVRSLNTREGKLLKDFDE
jgi:hypothetical protein